MGKNPAFQFFPGDWLRDTRVLTPEAKGVWIDLLCAMWWESPRGRLSHSYAEYARIANYHSDLRSIEEIIAELEINHICDVEEKQDTGEVIIICRRMHKEDLSRISHALAQGKYRGDNEIQKGDNNLQKDDNDLQGCDKPSSVLHYSKKKKNILSDDEWRERILKLHPWLDWDALNREMDTWLLTNPQRKKTRQFITNWILRKQKDKPMGPDKKGWLG
jgi:hypothetical protein